MVKGANHKLGDTKTIMYISYKEKGHHIPQFPLSLVKMWVSCSQFGRWQLRLERRSGTGTVAAVSVVDGNVSTSSYSSSDWFLYIRPAFSLCMCAIMKLFLTSVWIYYIGINHFHCAYPNYVFYKVCLFNSECVMCSVGAIELMIFSEHFSTDWSWSTFRLREETDSVRQQ